ncbi:MAG: hypothetical protein GY716_14615 [bacterium]|nr:hypothetical protein [bacterium]
MMRTRLILVLLALSAIHAAADELLGPSGAQFPLGTKPSGLAVTDVDGDGAPDVIVATENDNGAVRVLIGDGQGGYLLREESFALDPGAPELSMLPQELFAGDFDGDGDVDVAVTNRNQSSVSVLLGDGGGGFVFRGRFATESSPLGIDGADLDGDGLLDLAVACRNSNASSLLIGVGNGDFVDGERLTLSKARDVVAAHLDGDDAIDLAFAGDGLDAVVVFLGDGDGGFTSAGEHSVGRGPWGIVDGDLDGNGTVDLAVANFSEHTVSVLFGDGGGGFDVGEAIDVDRRPIALAAEDIDGDGDLDLLVANQAIGSGTLTALRNDGVGGFVAPCASGSNTACGLVVAGTPRELAVGDLDLDGALDLVLTDSGGRSVNVLLGNGLGGLSVPRTVAVGDAPEAVLAGDFDGNGLDDLAVSVSDEDAVRILRADGLGGVIGVSIDVGARPLGLAHALIDDDEHGDLAVATLGDDAVDVLLGDGDGGFVRHSTTAVWDNPVDVAAADFDRDGDTDLAVVNARPPDVVEGNFVSILLGNGTGEFVCASENCTDLPIPDSTGAVAVGDLTGDGRPDLAVTNQVSSIVRVFVNDGNAEFDQVPGDVEVGIQPTSIALADFDRNGQLDLAVGTTVGGSVEVYIGNGDGTFAATAQSVELDSGIVDIAAGDVNRDGLIDLIALNSARGSVIVLLGDGTGHFESGPQLSVGSSPGALALGDFNGNGALDAATSQSSAGTVALLLNQLDRRADVNGSNRIDGIDIATLGRSIGIDDSDPDYRRSADVNLDGLVNGDDLAIGGSRIGKLNDFGSPLRATLESTETPGPGTVTVQSGSSRSDLITIGVVANTDAAVASAEFALIFEPDEPTSAQALELVAWAAGDFLAGGIAQLLDVNDATPGRADVLAARLPLGRTEVTTGTSVVVRLTFRARREGEVRLRFEGSVLEVPALLDGADQPVAVTFSDQATIRIDSSGGDEPGQKIGVAPESLTFPATAIGTKSRRMLRVSNFGFAALRLESIVSSNDVFRTALGEAVDIAPFGFVEVPVEFAPLGEGAASGTLVLHSDDRERPTFEVPVEGSGLSGE